MKTVVVIPVRYGSSRFPGKPLVSIGGLPLIQQVWEQARKSRKADRIVIATDDPRIQNAVALFGGEVILTEGEFRTGTDRLAWVTQHVEADAYINLQGDEWIQDAAILDELIERFIAAQPLAMGTLRQVITREEEETDPNVVKVVCDRDGFALYFSRASIPVRRERETDSGTVSATVYKHLGIYIYGKNTLRELAQYPTGLLEDREKLEQLRALENGMRIRVWETDHESIRIDTPKDAEQTERLISKSKSPRNA